MKAQINMSLKRALVVYLPVIIVTILAIWISVFTHWNAMFYLLPLSLLPFRSCSACHWCEHHKKNSEHELRATRDG
jgi:hypothetical protein